jgi:FixJ family two-component response regulator
MLGTLSSTGMQYPVEGGRMVHTRPDGPPRPSSSTRTGLMSLSRPEVLVVDDDPSVRKAIARLIESAGHDVQTFGSAREFLEGWHGLGPAALLLDLRLPDLNGLELQKRLREREAAVQVIFMTGFGDVPTTVEAIKAGAFDFLLKPVPERILLSTVDSALAEAAKGLEELQQLQALAHRYELLTPREREVLRLVVTGRLNKQIARELRISEKTVKVHRGRVMQKMGTRRVAELVRFAIRLGLRPQPAQQTTTEAARRSGA